VGAKLTCVRAAEAVALGLKVKVPSFWTTDVLVALVPFPTPTETNAVAAVFMKISEYQTRPSTATISFEVTGIFLGYQTSCDKIASSTALNSALRP